MSETSKIVKERNSTENIILLMTLKSFFDIIFITQFQRIKLRESLGENYLIVIKIPIHFGEHLLGTSLCG